MESRVRKVLVRRPRIRRAHRDGRRRTRGVAGGGGRRDATSRASASGALGRRRAPPVLRSAGAPVALAITWAIVALRGASPRASHVFFSDDYAAEHAALFGDESSPRSHRLRLRAGSSCARGRGPDPRSRRRAALRDRQRAGHGGSTRPTHQRRGRTMRTQHVSRLSKAVSGSRARDGSDDASVVRTPGAGDGRSAVRRRRTGRSRRSRDRHRGRSSGAVPGGRERPSGPGRADGALSGRTAANAVLTTWLRPPIAPLGYGWFYLDGVSETAASSIVVIALLGNVFSPRWAKARRRDPTASSSTSRR